MRIKITLLFSLIAMLFIAIGNNELLANNLAGNSISGYVKDAGSDETLVGATVKIVGTSKGAFTNKYGYFSITNIPNGEYKIKISMVGYTPFEEKIKFTNGASQIRKDFLVKPNASTTEVVEVVADKEVESKQITMSTVNVPIKQIKEMRIGGESDVFRSLQMLPGVLTSSQISSGLYIRGGSPDQNLVLIDGATVYNPSHLFGFISTFNSEAIKDVELIKGGYPSEYGSRLSSVLNITQKDGNRNKVQGLASLGLISSKLSLEGPLGAGSWFIGGRRTYFDLIKGAIDNDPKSPIPDFGFYDLNGKITQHITPNDKIFAAGFISEDNFDYENSGMDVNMYMGNRSGSVKWTHIFGDDLFTHLLFSASQYHNGMSQDLSGFKMKIENTIRDYSLKGSGEWFATENLTVNSGFEINNYRFVYLRNFSGKDDDVKEGTNEGGKMNLVNNDILYAAYASINHTIMENMNLQVGVRANYWNYSKYFTLDPRVAFRYAFNGDFAMKASWGIFHQYLRLAGDENFSLFDTWLPTDKTVNPSEAIHYIISFETRPMEDIELNLDLYYKNLSNISETRQDKLEGQNVADVFYNGRGNAYGLELFLQKKIGRFAGWIGYGLGWVNATFDSINHGVEFRPKYDRRHDFKVVASYELDDTWTFGGTFMFQTGQSFTGATSSFSSGMPGENYGKKLVIPSQRYGLRMPNSHQMNVSVTYNSTLFGLPFKTILDIYNIYNRRDILQRTYNTNVDPISVEDIKLLPIIPTISFEIKF